ncbi:hypothetical protein [Halobacteriovorax sp.]|uniref:hypothetical protein n=1 Tax=Halobacteriovorax sp. TaxID=2020862 RepID=UPI003569014C
MLNISLGVLLLGSISSYSQDNFSEDSDDHLESSLEDYRKENQKLVKSIQDNHGGSKSSALGSLDLDKLRPLVKNLNSIYSRMSYQASREQVEQNIGQSPAKGVAKTFPKTVDFMTHLLRDNRALLGLLDMFKDKKKLTYFLLANIFTFILGFILARMSSKKGSIFKRLFGWIFRKTFIFGLRIFILIFFFGSELAPTFNIFQNVFL